MDDYQKSEKYLEDMFNSISLIVDKKLEQISYDKTIRCYIKTSPSEDNDNQYEYTVSYGNVTFTAYSIGIQEYEIGEVVYVSIPQGDFGKQKFILGKEY